MFVFLGFLAGCGFLWLVRLLNIFGVGFSMVCGFGFWYGSDYY